MGTDLISDDEVGRTVFSMSKGQRVKTRAVYLRVTYCSCLLLFALVCSDLEYVHKIFYNNCRIC